MDRLISLPPQCCVGILLPAVHFARETAHSFSCKNNMRQVGLAVQSYELTFGVYPPTFLMRHGRTQRGSWSIHARILPFVEQHNAYGRVDASQDWHSQQQWGIPSLRIPVFHCPSDPNSVVRLRNHGERYVQPTNARSYHRGLVNCVFLDGSVRAIHNEINADVWRAMGTRNAGGHEPASFVAP